MMTSSQVRHEIPTPGHEDDRSGATNLVLSTKLGVKAGGKELPLLDIIPDQEGAEGTIPTDTGPNHSQEAQVNPYENSTEYFN